jgi:hypothetical protein
MLCPFQSYMIYVHYNLFDSITGKKMAITKRIESMLDFLCNLAKWFVQTKSHGLIPQVKQSLEKILWIWFL